MTSSAPASQPIPRNAADPRALKVSRAPGAQVHPDGSCTFRVWAPNTHSARVIFENGTPPLELAKQTESHDDGIFLATAIPGAAPAGARYRIALDTVPAPLPDPASRFQPDGVHGPSEIADPANFRFTDLTWRGLELRDLIFYELHIGTFTPGATLRSAIARLEELKTLGVTAIELMPVAQFSGTRNWGYDGVFPYAVQNSYGGPAALQAFVDAAHAKGLAVILDVVYNHLGPEGNVLGQFGPYFTDRYRTPWGPAINFDGADSTAVREFFFENALYWLRDFHLDGLRLDAVHGIFDLGATHFLAELHDRVAALEKLSQRRLHLIAESDLNDSRIVTSRANGGYEMSAQWSDDFHHALHTQLTGEHNGYYADFHGLRDLATILRQGWRYSGDYSPSRRRNHGNSARDIAPDKLVVAIQNHDQVGNRAKGDRLTATLTFDQLKLAAATVLLSPFTPLLFMGEEYAARNPFPYFVSHADPGLTEAVRKGRREEFASFGFAAAEIPDPQAEETFKSAILSDSQNADPRAQTMYAFYAELIRLRKETGIAGIRPEVRENSTGATLQLDCAASKIPVTLLLNFGAKPWPIDAKLASESELLLDSSKGKWSEANETPDKAINEKEKSVAPFSAVLLKNPKLASPDTH
jgi:maltooligosyltrehalose trehalohydrolase